MASTRASEAHVGPSAPEPATHLRLALSVVLAAAMPMLVFLLGAAVSDEGRWSIGGGVVSFVVLVGVVGTLGALAARAARVAPVVIGAATMLGVAISSIIKDGSALGLVLAGAAAVGGLVVAEKTPMRTLPRNGGWTILVVLLVLGSGFGVMARVSPARAVQDSFPGSRVLAEAHADGRPWKDLLVEPRSVGGGSALLVVTVQPHGVGSWRVTNTRALPEECIHQQGALVSYHRPGDPPNVIQRVPADAILSNGIFIPQDEAMLGCRVFGDGSDVGLVAGRGPQGARTVTVEAEDGSVVFHETLDTGAFMYVTTGEQESVPLRFVYRDGDGRVIAALPWPSLRFHASQLAVLSGARDERTVWDGGEGALPPVFVRSSLLTSEEFRLRCHDEPPDSGWVLIGSIASPDGETLRVVAPYDVEATGHGPPSAQQGGSERVEAADGPAPCFA